MSEQMTEQTGNSDEPEEQPDYRLSHLMQDLAEPFGDAGILQLVAPFRPGGVSARVQNRATFTKSSDVGHETVEGILDANGYAWTTGEPSEYVVLGRKIRDLRELRKGDRIHLNSRGGPFKVYRVMDQSPEALRRSGPAVTVELANLGSPENTDWMAVHYESDDLPMAYVKTRDTNSGVSGDSRYKKVEDITRMGRVGPERLFAPSHDSPAITEDYQDAAADHIRTGHEHGLDVHPSDTERALNLLGSRPAADVYTPEDAATVQRVMDATADAYESAADALAIESDEDRERARKNQSEAEDAAAFAAAFNLARMDAIEGDIYACEDCGKAFTDRFKYPTHRRDCPADD